MTEAQARRPRRWSKAALHRVKWAVGGASVLAFAGSLWGIVALNPGGKLAAASTAAAPTAPQADPVAPSGGLSAGDLPAAPQLNDALTAPTRPQAPRLRPFTRTRGS